MPIFSGSIVAIITPLLADGRIDYPSFAALLDRHAEAGTDGIVVAGTTGESATITVSEQAELIAFAVRHRNAQSHGERQPLSIIAGTGANSTAEAIELTHLAKAAGADGCLSVVPYYNRPSQSGLYRHFCAIAESVDLPMILYNVPSRTVADLDNDTVVDLAQIPGIVGLKDATGKINVATDLVRRLPPQFALLSGDDMTSAAMLMIGFHGVISVTANIAPALVKALCNAAAKHDLATLSEIHRRLFLLNQDLFCEANPIPVKWAAAELGWCGNSIRLPLTPLDPKHQAKVRQAMAAAGLL